LLTLWLWSLDPNRGGRAALAGTFPPLCGGSFRQKALPESIIFEHKFMTTTVNTFMVANLLANSHLITYDDTHSLRSISTVVTVSKST